MLVRIFDNGGETFDRYTVAIIDPDTNRAGLFTMAADPSRFNQFMFSNDADSIEPMDNEIELDSCPESIYQAVHERMHYQE